MKKGAILLIGIVVIILGILVVKTYQGTEESMPHMSMDNMNVNHVGMNEQQYIQNVEGLKEKARRDIQEILDGEKIKLSAEIIKGTIDNQEVKLFGYNSQVPGPLLKVEQESTVYVEFTNNLDVPTTVHWHGLRHDNKYDGVPDITQPPIKSKETYTYTVSFPDEGIYWYHPHIREDYQQDLGLAGNILVTPSNGKKANVNREEVLLFDDLLIKNKKMVPYYREDANFALMGRFGNIMLINGNTNYNLDVKKGEVIRFYMTNVANVRPFKLSFDGAKMKSVGSDIGFYEQEEFVESITIHPAERYIVDVFFENEGTYKIQNNNPQKTYDLGIVTAASDQVEENHAESFMDLQQHADVKKDIDMFKQYFDKPVDYTIDLTVDMIGMDVNMMEHMEMMKHAAEEETIEWEDPMPSMNEQMTSKTVKWILKDKKTGKKNMDFTMEANVGDVLKIRLFNDPDSMHPMQHPIHLHGQRFLVLSENDIPNQNLVWKDTVAVPKGSTIDILVDVTNPGEWMLHCHIAEHLTAGMMIMMEVKE